MGKNRLGKGLGALITDNGYEDNRGTNGRLKEVLIHQIEPNPFQPRQEFDPDDLNELAQSIKENGIIQPITLRQVKPDLYQIVTGERRWRASRLVGLKEIPAIIRKYTDIQMMETALIENLQREDLNPIEEAQAYQRMMEEFNMTQEEVAKKVGKSRSSIANTVRLLNLPPKVQVYVSRETMSMGHARALLSLKDSGQMIKAAEHVIKNNLSVRETEKYIQNQSQKTQENRRRKEGVLEPEWKKAQSVLEDYLGTRVKIKKKDNKKIITIECNSYLELQKLLIGIQTRGNK